MLMMFDDDEEESTCEGFHAWQLSCSATLAVLQEEVQ